MSDNKRVESLTPRSIESLYIVNSIRDYLHEHTKDLGAMGIVEVVVHGSVIKGKAQEASTSLKKFGLPSDIDINFLLNADDRYHDDDKEYDRRSPAIKGFIEKMRVKINTEIPLHILVSPMNPDGSYPNFIDDKLSLWSVPDHRPLVPINPPRT